INRDVTFAAPLETVDANGRRWRFRGWSNGGPAAQTLRVSQEMVNKGLYLIAQYEPLNRLTIETNPPGLPITVDGQDCPAPCMVERLATESVVVAPAPSVTQADVLRLEFDNWSDGGSGARSVPLNVDSRRLVANYRQLYRLSALGNPPEGASFVFNPTSADGFYALGAQVNITARANNGFRFLRWGGDTAGMFPSTTITISGPRGVVAELSRVPFLDSAGIKNAAGTGPQDEGPTGKVAPGSLITIYGANLTPKEEIGPRSPQLQSLAEVAVRVGERFLPLSFASANQINAQLPFDLPLGPSRLTIVRNGQAEVGADFELIRNAPGLFGQQGTESDSQPPLALAFRADGSIVTEAAPALPNEVLSLTGTGLGPFRSILPAGFALPQGFEVALTDPVEILAGDQSIQPLRVFAMPGFVGLTSIQFRVGPQFPVGQSTSLRVRVNGKDSNSVRLLVR
ncbi:MAG: InlB B-repeat-containing protein, partial [Acidobacteriota bacterium]